MLSEVVSKQRDWQFYTWCTNQPFSIALHGILIVSFNSNGDAGAGFGGGERLIVDPAFENTSKTTLTHHAPLTEISSCFFQLIKAKSLHIWALQNLVLGSWTWMNRCTWARTVWWFIVGIPFFLSYNHTFQSTHLINHSKFSKSFIKMKSWDFFSPLFKYWS